MGRRLEAPASLDVDDERVTTKRRSAAQRVLLENVGLPEFDSAHYRRLASVRDRGSALEAYEATLRETGVFHLYAERIGGANVA